MTYEALLIEADCNNLSTQEKPLRYNDGRIKGSRILIRSTLPTSSAKACVLAEELGHYYTTNGNILDQSDWLNRKQERHARIWAYQRLIPFNKLLEAQAYGCRNIYEMADYFGVTEEFLQNTIDYYMIYRSVLSENTY